MSSFDYGSFDPGTWVTLVLRPFTGTKVGGDRPSDRGAAPRRGGLERDDDRGRPLLNNRGPHVCMRNIYTHIVSICVCVCIYIWIFVYIYIYTYTYTYLCMHGCEYVFGIA